MNEAEEYFNSVERDSWHWLDNSEKLKYSSEVIYKKLNYFIEMFRKDGSFENEEKIRALWGSYYLLVGLSFENLVKGLSIENNMSAKDFSEIFNKWGDRSGHQISKIAIANIPLLTKEELSIIEKLETYIMWAGRFNLPRTSDRYTKERKRLFFYSKDYDVINSLYDRTRDILKQAYERNEGYK